MNGYDSSDDEVSVGIAAAAEAHPAADTSSSDGIDDILCSVCGRGDDEANLIECEADCGRWWHLRCCSPPLRYIPEGAWACAGCSAPAVSGRAVVGDVADRLALDAGRVWFTSVASGTDSGSGFLGGKPTGKAFRTPPQACSLKFNAEGKVVKYTIGHVMERSIGNTGGLGGIFGPAYAIGKPLPFPEAKPWKPSKRYRLLQTVGNLASRLQKKQKKE